MINTEIDRIYTWSNKHQLSDYQPKLQVVKVYEELGELSEGVLQLNRAKILDSIGDVFVTLVVLSQQININIKSKLDFPTASKYETYRNVTDLMLEELYPTICSITQHVSLLQHDDMFDSDNVKGYIRAYVSDVLLILNQMCNILDVDFKTVLQDVITELEGRTHERVIQVDGSMNINLEG